MKRGKTIKFCATAKAKEFVPGSFRDYFLRKYSFISSEILNIVYLIKHPDPVLRKHGSIFFWLYVPMDVIMTSLTSSVTILLVAVTLPVAVKIKSAWICLLISVLPSVIFGYASVVKEPPFQVSTPILIYSKSHYTLYFILSYSQTSFHPVPLYYFIIFPSVSILHIYTI